jgi:hypothetical protein
MTRDELELDSSPEKTSFYRGQIAELRFFLSMEEIIKTEYNQEKEKSDE